jgi:hypothetical protein
MFSGEGEPMELPLIRPLFEDAVEYDRQLSVADSQFARRGYIRAGFALIEGEIYWFKGVLQRWLLDDFHATGQINVTAFSLLDDNSYTPQANGRVESLPQRMSFRNHCAFVLRAASDLVGHDSEKLFSDNGWNTLKKALEIRHRLTHPKKPEDLDVSDSDIFNMREGYRWLWNSFVGIVAASTRPE